MARQHWVRWRGEWPQQNRHLEWDPASGAQRRLGGEEGAREGGMRGIARTCRVETPKSAARRWRICKEGKRSILKTCSSK